MKGIKILSIILIAIGTSLSFGCDGDRDLDCEYFDDCETSTGGGGGGTSAGNVTFWNNQNWVGQITVSLSGSYGYITSNVTPSSCNTSGCANFSRPAGSYNYTATANTGEHWSGTINVSSGGCLLVKLQ